MESDVGKLFIGGISWETTEEKLKNYFNAYGEVVEAVIMKDRATGRARGFGFVVFADPIVADRVVQDKHNIDGRQVEAKKAVPREEQQVATRNSNVGLAPVHQARTKKIFVGGLAATVTENDFRNYFDQFGVITDVVVMYDHGTQRPRGFGFITYDSEDAVDRVLHTSFHELKGKMVEVKRAIPKEMSPSPVRSTGSALGSALRGGGPYGSGYGQFNSSPIGPFGLRMDNRYSPSPGMNYSPYGPVGYGSGRSFSGAMNAAYNSAYGGAIQDFGRSTNHGSFTTSGIFGGSGSGYGSSPAGGGYGSMTPGRNPWSSGAVGYGSPNVAGGYRHGGGASMAGYSSGLGTWGFSQLPSSSSGFYTGNVNYGGADDEYGSGNLGYTGRGSGFGSSGDGYSAGASNSAPVAREAGFGDLYSSLAHQETSWKSSAGTESLDSASFGGRFGGFGLGDTSGEDNPAGYSSAYASGRQAPRGVQV